ncbi:MAG: dimethyl sulfoxide reductase anchor subunit [Rhizobiaceae bacterium]|nr:dimethyl sulfoxide reductase anchor subunit [Rhizobiaceae bacterium]
MHPALSVIFFTVTSGAGFGMMSLIGLNVPMPGGGVGAFAACLLAAGLAIAGLVSSTFHLGHPERAWRAFSQWRSSWLSREGVCAVTTLFAFAIYGLVWVFWNERVMWIGWIVSIGSMLTVFTTSMIYAQLKTVPLWNTWLTPVCYLLFSLGSGLFLCAAFGYWQWIPLLSLPVFMAGIFLVLIAWIVKVMWWRRIMTADFSRVGSSPGTATGLGELGKVRLLERPHTGENYLTREMVHKIGRKHAGKLRLIAMIVGGFMPMLCMAPMLTGVHYPLLFAMAGLLMTIGLLVERWLFFAEAKHAVSLYY